MKNRCLYTVGLMLLGVVAFGASPAQAITLTPDALYVLGNLETAAGDAATSSYGVMSAASVSLGGFSPSQAAGGGSLLTFTPVSQGIGGVGSAKATADISALSLLTYSQTLGITGASAASGSAFWDTLTFSGPGGTGTFNFVIPGNFVDGGSPGAAQGAACLSVGGGSTLSNCINNATELNSGNELVLLQSNFSLGSGTVSELVFAADATQVSGSFGIATADMFDPPTLSLTLPAGETFTSASGVFPGSSPAPVPEPSTLLLLGSGMTGLVAMRRLRKQ